jgi:hypothetical protein
MARPMDKRSTMRAMGKQSVLAVVALMIIIVIPSWMESANAMSSISYPPIIISKADPWTPLSGPHDGVEPCSVTWDPIPIDGWAYAWIELSNTTNETLTTVGSFDMEVKSINPQSIGGTGSSQEFASSLILEPKQSCIIATSNIFSTRNGVGGSEGNGPAPGADKDGATVSIGYTIGNSSKYSGVYAYTTPALSDPYGDLAYWQLDLDSSRWMFRDDMAGARNSDRVTLTGMTMPSNIPIMVNMTLPKRILAPSVVPLELYFFNSTTKQPIDGMTIIYQIEYKGSPLLYSTMKNDGHTSTASDVKYIVVNQTGSLGIDVRITALNREASGGAFERLANPEVVQFTAVAVPEFSPGIVAAIMGLTMAGIIATRRFKK